jgi:hypothetical protein
MIGRMLPLSFAAPCCISNPGWLNWGQFNRRIALLRFGPVRPLVLTSIVFSLAMNPLMFGKKP